MGGVKLSHTANERYQLSPRSYYLHYMLKLRPKMKGSALVFGSAVDEALNLLLIEHFWKKKTVTPEDALIQMLSSAEINNQVVDLNQTKLVKWSKADLDKSVWTEADHKSKDRPELVTLKRKGLMILDAYREQVLPHFSELISSQEKISIKNAEGDEITGVIDFRARFSPKGELREKYGQYDGKILTCDNKTTSVVYKDDSVRTSKQLATYTEVPGVENDACAFVVIPKKFRSKKLPLIPISIIVDKPEQHVIESTFVGYEQTLKGVKLGDFPCTRMCLESPFGCDYKNYCESNGTNKEGLVYVRKD